MALTVGTGFASTDAIVMIENIVAPHGEGEAPMQAALDGGARSGHGDIAHPVAHRRVHPRCS